MQPLPEKQCRICKEFKTRDNFYKSKKLPGGLVHECKTCIAILSKAYVESNDCRQNYLGGWLCKK